MLIIYDTFSTDDVYQVISGLKGGDRYQNWSTNQGWKRSGIPGAFLFLEQLFQMARGESPGMTRTEIHDDVRKAYGGRDPFADLEVFKHYLAAAATSLSEGHDDSYAILWNSWPSVLSSHTSHQCFCVSYNSVSARTALTISPTASPATSTTVNTQIKKDGFTGAFLQLDQQGELVAQVIEDLKKDAPPQLCKELEQIIASEPCQKISQIIILQVLILSFYHLRSNRQILNNKAIPVKEHE